jgi:5'-nucleotidase
MYTLLTNDDGIQADGLLALKQALSRLGEVSVIAPDRDRSTAGHMKTTDRPLRLRPVTLGDGTSGLACDGTPTDCVALGLLGVLRNRPDIIVAGINHGANLAEDVTYSGVVAAAMEGRVSGVPAIVVSVMEGGDWDFVHAADFTTRLARTVLSKGGDSVPLLNVNIPSVPRRLIKGVDITRLGHRIYRNALDRRQDPSGGTYYWISSESPAGTMGDGTDIRTVAQNRISVTPLHLDLTHHQSLDDMKTWRIRV